MNKQYPATGNIRKFKSRTIPVPFGTSDRSNYGEVMDLPTYMEGVTNGFSIRDSEGIHSLSGEILEARTIGKDRLPNTLQELRDYVEPFQAGPWEDRVEVHFPTLAQQTTPDREGRVYSLPAAFANAALKYNRLKSLDIKRQEMALRFVRKAARKGDRKTVIWCARIYNRILMSPLTEPVELSFEPVVEDIGEKNDLISRCQQDDTSYHDGHEMYQADLEKDCVCFSTAGKILPYPEIQRMRKREKVLREERFQKWLVAIMLSNKKALANAFRYSPNPKKTGSFHRKALEAQKRSRRNPDDVWLTADQRLILTYKARKKLGWSISGAFKSIVLQAAKRLNK